MARKDIHRLVLALLLCCVQVTGTDVFGQADWTDGELGKVVADSLRLAQGEAGTAPVSVAVPDSVAGLLADSLAETADSIAAENRRKTAGTDLGAAARAGRQPGSRQSVKSRKA